MESWVGLVDCNNFFVSCERLFRPDLKHRPVVVLSSNDGCVVARSQEIKDKGIPMAVPYFQVKDIIKDIDAVTFSSHFALYRDISRRVFTLLEVELNTIEQYSIDECFFALKGDKDEVHVRIRQIKTKIEAQVGIPVSIGLGKSKTLAKCAVDLAKKGEGTAVLDDVLWAEIKPQKSLASLWGVGKKTTVSFKEKGLFTVADFLQLNSRDVASCFGVAGSRLWLELSGIPAYPLEKKRSSRLSLLHTRSFKKSTTDKAAVADAVAYHIRAAALALRKQAAVTGFLQVMLGTSRHGDYLLQGGIMGVHLDSPTSDTYVLLKEAMSLFESIYTPTVPYKKAGILLADLRGAEEEQLALFSDSGTKRTVSLMPVIDGLNAKFGSQTLMLGTRLRHDTWETAQTLRSPAYTTAWVDIPVVKA